MIPENEINIKDFSLKIVNNVPTAPVRYINIKYIPDEIVQEDETFSKIQFPFARTKTFAAPINFAKITASTGAKPIVELILDVDNNSQCDYMPGDTIGIITENPNETVDQIIDFLQLHSKADEIFEISLSETTKHNVKKLPMHIPTKTTPRHLLKYFLNVHSIPKKLLIRALVDYTDNPNEKQFLKTICSKDGAHFYSKLITKPFTFFDILKYCRSCQPPLEILIEHLPRLLPRSYSIANSPVKSKNNIKICLSVLEKSPGLTTSLLKNLAEKCIDKKSINENEEIKINLYHRDFNRFRYTEEESTKNLIMISVGCAVSPFLGFLEHKNELYRKSDATTTWLFSGFRNKENCFCKKDLEYYQENNVLTKWFQCYSKEETIATTKTTNDSGCKWKYVQDAIKDNQEEFIDLLMKENTLLYVCADGAEISKCICETIIECLENALNLNSDESNELIKSFRKSFKYREDIW